MSSQNIIALSSLLLPLIVGGLAFFAPGWGLALLGVVMIYVGAGAIVGSVAGMPYLTAIATHSQPTLLIVGGILACGLAGGIARTTRRRRWRDED